MPTGGLRVQAGHALGNLSFVGGKLSCETLHSRNFSGRGWETLCGRTGTLWGLQYVVWGGVLWGFVGVGLRAKRVAIWRTCPILWLGVGLLGEAGGAGGEGLLGATFPQIHPAPGPQDAE
jgi:hypothetical protein